MHSQSFKWGFKILFITGLTKFQSEEHKPWSTFPAGACDTLTIQVNQWLCIFCCVVSVFGTIRGGILVLISCKMRRQTGKSSELMPKRTNSKFSTELWCYRWIFGVWWLPKRVVGLETEISGLRNWDFGAPHYFGALQELKGMEKQPFGRCCFATSNYIFIPTLSTRRWNCCEWGDLTPLFHNLVPGPKGSTSTPCLKKKKKKEGLRITSLHKCSTKYNAFNTHQGKFSQRQFHREKGINISNGTGCVQK